MIRLYELSLFCLLSRSIYGVAQNGLRLGNEFDIRSQGLQRVVSNPRLLETTLVRNAA